MNYIEELEREKAYAESMANAAKIWMYRARKAEQNEALMIAALTHAAGGKIEVFHDTLMIAPKLELIHEYLPHNLSWTFRTRKAPATCPGSPSNNPSNK
jgi:hypothetical protein